MSASLAFAPIGELADQFRSGELSAASLVQCYADRIAALNASSKAFIALDLDRAMATAESLVIGPGDNPLEAIPYACKDLFDVKGMVTSGGSRVLADNIAEHDADAITRMNWPGQSSSARTICMSLPMARPGRMLCTARPRIPTIKRASPVVRAAARQRPSVMVCALRHWVPTPADRYARRRRCAGWSVSNQPLDVSAPGV